MMRPTTTTFLVCLIVATLTACARGASPARFNGTLYMASKSSTPTYSPGVFDTAKGTAWAIFDDGEYNTKDGGNGWGVLYLNLSSTLTLDDASAMYAAGYLEGAITYKYIENFYTDYMFDWFGKNGKESKSLSTYMSNSLSYVQTQCSKNPNDPYWSEVNLLLNQLNGIVDGYNSVAGSSNQRTLADFFLMNADGDLEDITDALGEAIPGNVLRKRFGHSGVGSANSFMGHCSASVKVLPNNADLFFSHDTWSSYGQMVRIFKHYSFPLARAANETGGTRRVSLSSYPGIIASIDDWYISNKGLVITETTNEFYNDTMYKMITSDVSKTLLSFWRAMVATYNANTGPEWISWFCQQNSGTYDNQWMIVDLKLFQPNMATLPDNLLWVAESEPDLCMSADQTDTLRQTSYWASYNVPFFPYVYTVSGYAAEYKKYGNEYSYTLCPRAQIFKRDMANVTDYISYRNMMDSNDYLNDPLTLGEADEAIMARGDLVKSFPVPSGAIDSKVSTWSRALQLECDAKQGPTHQSLPAYSWTQFSSVTHVGMPDIYDFEYIVMNPSNAAVSPFPYGVQTKNPPPTEPSQNAPSSTLPHNGFGRNDLPAPVVM